MGILASPCVHRASSREKAGLECRLKYMSLLREGMHVRESIAFVQAPVFLGHTQAMKST